MTDPDQAWFWTPEWQAGEREADADLAAGRSQVFLSEEDFLAWIDESMDWAQHTFDACAETWPEALVDRLVHMRFLARLTALLAVLLVGSAVAASPAWAGSPHFVDDKVQASIDGDTLTVVFKEAGLGDEPQVHIVLTADAACINPGGNHPQAANKESFNAAGDFPVQNGRAEGSLSVTAVFSPSCSPPMTVAWSNIVLTDETSGISTTLP